jgi:hypothetical protein
MQCCRGNFYNFLSQSLTNNVGMNNNWGGDLLSNRRSLKSEEFLLTGGGGGRTRDGPGQVQFR